MNAVPRYRFGVADVIAHNPHASTIAAIGATVSFLGALNWNAVAVACGTIIAVTATAWGMYRDQTAKDRETERRNRLEEAVVRARIAAIEAGKPDPFPEQGAMSK